MAFGQSKYAGKPAGQVLMLEPGNPGNQTPYTLIVPAGYVYLIKSIRLQLVADANAANRNVFAAWATDAGVVFLRSVATFNHTAGLTRSYNFFGQPGPPITALGAGPGGSIEYHVSMPWILVPPGWRFLMSCVNMQATDQLQNIKVIGEFWRTL